MRLDKAHPSKKLPTLLHKEVQDLFHYLWSQETRFLYDFGIIEKIPFKLRHQVFEHMFNDFIDYFDLLF